MLALVDQSQLRYSLMNAITRTGDNMLMIDAIAIMNESSDPNPEEAVDSQLEWEQERRGIEDGTVCDDGMRWSDEENFHHLFGRNV